MMVAACCAPPGPTRHPTTEAVRVWKLVAPTGGFGSAFPIRCEPRAGGGWTVHMLTARHVVQDARGASLGALRPGAPLLAFLAVRTNPDQDAAIVSFRSPVWIRPHELERRPLKTGARVWHSGYQLGDLAITDGYVTGENRITAPSAPGASGGPVFDESGRVVAYVVSVAGSSRTGPVFHLVRVVPIIAIADWL